VAETVDGERVTVTRFDRYLMMVRVASGEAPILVMALTASVMTGGPPRSNKLAR
jgi:hypothetical protein